ncbi:isoprenylcysteine carboxyl methyltransferase [Algimonas arctica]|uniref:Isoprenylcysteine carboxyl methyltransferase n=1 Tax=Algimonas arctica TaxID=1479486 RepID=A0A8J3CRA0_9PROT|nr:isoprenylcysteine carboxylmethyltransferase family protein [Algimonas arctica]GHA97659.1 isoprenylcysteine carboxyl methyltransferase [Algimonas arctica]
MRIPPLIIFTVPVLLGWVAAGFGVVGDDPMTGQVLFASALFLSGIIFMGVAVFGFKMKRTTVDPIRPEAASALVTNGIYAISRNPMYVGMAACSIGVCVFFGLWVGLAMAVIAVAYITQFQIKPEEKVLTKIFGKDYSDYRQNVRRWL